VRLFLLLLLTTASPLSAQWSLTLQAGSSRAHGHARALDEPDQPELRPDRPTSLELGVGRQFGSWRVILSGRHTSADLTASGTTAAVVSKSALDGWGFGLELGRRVAGRAGTPTLELGIGVIRDHWDLGTADDARWRQVYRAAAVMTVPVWRTWGIVVREEFGIGSSLFHDADIPQGYRLRPGWETGLLLGVRRVW